MGTREQHGAGRAPGLRAARRTSISALAAFCCATVLTVAQTPSASATSETRPPSPPGDTDTVATPYGPLGKWMLQIDCQYPDNCGISNWLGHPYKGNTLYEPINVILVDKSSSTQDEAIEKLGKDMKAAGFPARIGHTNGYHALLPDAHGTPTPHGQQPSASDHAFADAWFFAPLIDHGRVFGPTRTGDGYVWTAALSAEKPGIYIDPDGRPSFTHDYASFKDARNKLCADMTASGAGRCGFPVDMKNEYNEGSITTGDHDGRAAVIELS
ncbi:hypothetical protein [Kitasatospora sp. NPDC056731]|uniref:hypothetical protein n=1 Tax=Kitasatospora sp. NPDC056731 TaxID=3155422 RepID=UPI0034337489